MVFQAFNKLGTSKVLRVFMMVETSDVFVAFDLQGFEVEWTFRCLGSLSYLGPLRDPQCLKFSMC